MRVLLVEDEKWLANAESVSLASPCAGLGEPFGGLAKAIRQNPAKRSVAASVAAWRGGPALPKEPRLP